MSGGTPTRPTRRAFLAAPALLASVMAVRGARADDIVLAGASVPMTGPGARYGAQFKRGFDLALEGIDNLGGAGGRPLQYLLEDTRSDPQRAATAAQAFVADPRVVVALDGASASDLAAASSTLRNAGLAQIALAASDPAAAGNLAWSLAPTDAAQGAGLWSFADALGLRRPAVLYPDTGAGRSARDAFAGAAGGSVAGAEAYVPGQDDFRSALTRLGNANPDGLVLLSDYADAALICHQARDSGSKLPVLAAAGSSAAEFAVLGGAAAEGVFVLATFFAGSPRPEAQDFVKRYRAKYSADADGSSAVAFDATVLVSRLVGGWGPTREGVQKGLAEIKDVPSVVYGRIAFDPQTHHVQGAAFQRLLVRGGRFIPWDGVKPA